MRLFFACLPDATVRDQVAAAAEALPLAAGSRPVPRENIHVTLAFVGEVAPLQLPRLIDIGRAQQGKRFTLRFDAYEYWPKPEVVVAAARTVPAAMELLWQQLHGELASHQWALDPKRLRPHVTLARKVLQAPTFGARPACDWPVHEFSLMRSETGGAQPAYTVVDTWSLLDNTAKT